MPCLYGQHNKFHLFLDVGIIDASGINLAPGPLQPAGAFSAPQMFKALVDTGAERTMISTDVVNRLQLVSVGQISVSGVGQNVPYHNGYLFHVAFVIPFILPGQVIAQGAQIPATVYTQPTPIYGAEISAGRGFDVLLGMDVICTGSLKVEGNGTFSFSF